jgi:hypothetical protein
MVFPGVSYTNIKLVYNRYRLYRTYTYSYDHPLACLWSNSHSREASRMVFPGVSYTNIKLVYNRYRLYLMLECAGAFFSMTWWERSRNGDAAKVPH